MLWKGPLGRSGSSGRRERDSCYSLVSIDTLQCPSSLCIIFFFTFSRILLSTALMKYKHAAFVFATRLAVGFLTGISYTQPWTPACISRPSIEESPRKKVSTLQRLHPTLSMTPAPIGFDSVPMRQASPTALCHIPVVSFHNAPRLCVTRTSWQGWIILS